jgi:FixJ family two-component response regulator
VNHPVYLVDDDEAVRRAFGLLLSTVGIRATGFADPQSFLAQAPKLEPGCLILDIRMPAISGLKLQERLVAQGVDWPTIVVSGHGDIDAGCAAAGLKAIDAVQ